MKYSVLLSLLCLTPLAYGSEPYKVVCYLGSWANYRHGDGKFVIEDINAKLCSHLVYGFVKLSDDNRIAAYDTYLDLKENYGLGKPHSTICLPQVGPRHQTVFMAVPMTTGHLHFKKDVTGDTGAYERFNNLRMYNPGLKTLIAIGGWNEGSAKYSRMVSNPAFRKTFIDSCLEFMSLNGFDGLDLDWEYPANRGGEPSDKQNFVSLIKELREAFKPRGYLLTAAVSAGKNTIDSAYDIAALGRYLDFINLMAYDFHGGWDQATGHNAPLYAKSNDSEGNKLLTVDYAVKYWISQGCPAEKLILGMPLYGRSFALQNPSQNGLGAPINGKGMAGEFTGESGMLGYNEICKILKYEKGWNVVFDSNSQSPYAFKGNEWISYDNPKSIYLKVQYLKKMKLGGGMVWSLETDDFRGRCHGEKYPLLSAINDALGSRSNPETTSPGQDNQKTPEYITKTPEYITKTPEYITKTPEYITKTPEYITKAPEYITKTPEYITKTSTKRPDVMTPPSKPTPEDEIGELLPCPYAGYFRHPKDCKLFYFCLPKGGQNKENTIYPFRCPVGTVFSEKLRVCTFPSSVPECS